MSQSKTKTKHDEQISEEQVKELLEHWDIPYKDLNYAVSNDPDDIPYLILDHDSYSGGEAHFFTVADLAVWIPELLPSGDVVLYYPLRLLDDKHPDALSRKRTISWEILAFSFDQIMHKIRVAGAHRFSSTDTWAHNEREPEGYIEIPENDPIPIDKILRRVDTSIKETILELNKAGFATIESCSGLKKDHEGSKPFQPYVALDDEYYLDVSAHIFTIAEASGWDPCWGAHGFEVLIYATDESEKELENAWKKLGEVAKEFGEELESYRELVEPWQETFYYRFRRERGLFSRFYCEKSRTLSGLIDELEEIDKEYYNEKEENE